MADLHHRGHWLRLRYLRTVDAPADTAPGPRTTRRVDVRHTGIHPMARPDVLCSGGVRRSLRFTRRLSDGPPGPPKSVDLEHPALRVFGSGSRFRDFAADAARASDHDVRRRVRRIRSRGRVARCTLSRTKTPRSHSRLHSGVLVARWIPGQPDGGPHREDLAFTPGDSRRSRYLALPADLGFDPGDPIDRYSSVPTRITGVEREEARGNA